MAQKNFPRTPAAAGATYDFSPDGTLPVGVPSVCIFFDKDNPCQAGQLNALSIPPSNPLDPITQVLRDQLIAYDKLKQRNCVSNGVLNRQLALYWTWNTDPDFVEISRLPDPDGQLQPVLSIIRGLAAGLGIVPRELILKLRMQTLENYVNTAPQNGVTFETVQSNYEKSGPTADVAAYERTIQAFKSAFNTLGDHTFDDSKSIVMDELLPSAAGNANLLKLNWKTEKFDVFSLEYLLKPSSTGNPTQDCTPYLVGLPVGIPMPVAAEKDPSVLTYYAIKLSAKAQVLFSPVIGDVTLTAYAAAKPFGSRIGPKSIDSDWVEAKKPGVPSTCTGGATPTKCEDQIPNIKISEDGSTAWNSAMVLGAMYQKYSPLTGPVNITVGFAEAQRAQRAAMVPNPYEKGKYAIPHDYSCNPAVPAATSDPFVEYFDAGRMKRLYAPIFSRANRKPVEDELKAQINSMTAAGTGQTVTVGNQTTSSDFQNDVFRQALLQGLNRYADLLRQGRGEDGEGYDIAVVTDPFCTRPEGTGPSQPISFSQAAQKAILMNDPKDIRDSWSNLLDEPLRAPGRTGYSVKFASFQSLFNTSGSLTSDGSNTWTNFPTSTSDQELADLQKKVQH